jgi:hypothetical protein
MQCGEKQKDEDAVSHAAGGQDPRFEEFAEKQVGRGISVQRLQVEEQIPGSREDPEMWS